MKARPGQRDGPDPNPPGILGPPSVHLMRRSVAVEVDCTHLVTA
jgi:hypothetical protein